VAYFETLYETCVRIATGGMAVPTCPDQPWHSQLPHHVMAVWRCRRSGKAS